MATPREKLNLYPLAPSKTLDRYCFSSFQCLHYRNRNPVCQLWWSVFNPLNRLFGNHLMLKRADLSIYSLKRKIMLKQYLGNISICAWDNMILLDSLRIRNGWISVQLDSTRAGRSTDWNIFAYNTWCFWKWMCVWTQNYWFSTRSQYSQWLRCWSQKVRAALCPQLALAKLRAAVCPSLA